MRARSPPRRRSAACSPALGRLPAGDRVVTVSADVAITTHLAGWINRKGVYARPARPNPFAEIPQAMQWRESPAGQHIELGIAEHNLFLLLGALGLTRELGRRDALAHRHPLRSLRHPRAGRALPRALLGRALRGGGHAVRREPVPRGRRASVGDHAGHRHRAARHHLLGARLRPRGGVDPARRARAHGAGRGREPVPAPVHQAAGSVAGAGAEPGAARGGARGRLSPARRARASPAGIPRTMRCRSSRRG